MKRFIIKKTLHYKSTAGIELKDPIRLRTRIDLDMIRTVYEADDINESCYCLDQKNRFLFQIEISFGELMKLLQEYNESKQIFKITVN